MNTLFAETLRKLMAEKGLSQCQLGQKMFVNQSTVARWENGSRLPDAAMLTRLSKVLEVDVSTLLSASAQSEESPNIILVDDSKVLLTEGWPCWRRSCRMPRSRALSGRRRRSNTRKRNRSPWPFWISSWIRQRLDLCRSLLEINPRTNVVYLTAYPEYSLDAWNTDACGFMVKPLTAESVRRQLNKLRYPFLPGGAQE
jgi:transcriptional regulator with XRE-family HTH domain